MKLQFRNYAMMGIFMVTLLMGASVVQAELYVGGQVGLNAPDNLSDVKGTGSSSGLISTDLDLRNMVVFGVKAGGYFSKPLHWLGLEAEAYRTDSDIRQQQVTLNAPLLGLGASGTLPRTDIAVTTLAFNAVVRYPGEIFQPYGGIGVGLNLAQLMGGMATDETIFVPTLNFLGGIRAFVTQNIAFFGEFKHNRGTFEFKDNELEADYRTNMFLGGVMFHFR